MENINEIVRNNMRSLRTRAGYKQAEIAELMGITRASIVNWEQNPASVDLGKLFKLSKYYNCKLSDFTKDC